MRLNNEIRTLFLDSASVGARRRAKGSDFLHTLCETVATRALARAECTPQASSFLSLLPSRPNTNNQPLRRIPSPGGQEAATNKPHHAITFLLASARQTRLAVHEQLRETHWLDQVVVCHRRLGDETARRCALGSHQLPSRAIRRSSRCKSRQPRRWWHRDSQGQTRTPAPSNSTKQQTLSRFFAPNTAPAAHQRAPHTRKHPRRVGSAAPKLLGHQGWPPAACGYHHPSLEARTTTLSTTLSTTTIWKHARPVCFAVASAASLAPSAPARLRHPQRPCRHPHHRPMSLHGRHASKHGLESSTYVRQDQCFRPLSREPRRANVRSQTRRRLRFSPHSWPSRSPTLRPPHGPKAFDRKLALFQRMAGIQDDVVREQERRQMENELDRAHQRMQGSSPAAAKSKRPPTSRQRTSLAKQSEAAPTGRVSTRSEQMPETLLRSPVTNRRIYALETQLVPVKRAALQPASRADKNASEVVQNQPLCARTDPSWQSQQMRRRTSRKRCPWLGRRRATTRHSLLHGTTPTKKLPRSRRKLCSSRTPLAALARCPLRTTTISSPSRAWRWTLRMTARLYPNGGG